MGHTLGPLTVMTGETVKIVDSKGGAVATMGWLTKPHQGPRRSSVEVMATAELFAAAPDLLSIAKRWAAIDGGAWHVERYARERDELMADTRAVLAKARPVEDET